MKEDSNVYVIFSNISFYFGTILTDTQIETLYNTFSLNYFRHDNSDVTSVLHSCVHRSALRRTRTHAT